MKILQLCVTQIPPKHYLKRCKQQKWTLIWKHARLTSLQKTRLQPVFVCPFLLLYLLCYSYILSIFWADIFVSLNLVAVSTVWILKISWHGSFKLHLVHSHYRYIKLRTHQAISPINVESCREAGAADGPFRSNHFNFVELDGINTMWEQKLG